MTNPRAEDALRHNARQMMDDLSRGITPSSVWVGGEGTTSPAKDGTNSQYAIVADAEATQARHTIQLEYAGVIYTAYSATDVANGAPQPMTSFDDAEYWFGEQFSDDKGWLGVATELATGQKMFFACCATSWDRDGQANAWESIATQDRSEADRFRARRAILNALEG